MSDDDLTLTDLLAAWNDQPAKLRRAVRVVVAVAVTSALTMLIAWGLGAFTTWQASPGNWSSEARGSVAGLWAFCQLLATPIVVAAAWDE